eukprot:scaffold1313_cov349-Pavlova_lutheri.AAC.8
MDTGRSARSRTGPAEAIFPPSGSRVRPQRNRAIPRSLLCGSRSRSPGFETHGCGWFVFVAGKKKTCSCVVLPSSVHPRIHRRVRKGDVPIRSHPFSGSNHPRTREETGKAGIRNPKGTPSSQSIGIGSGSYPLLSRSRFPFDSDPQTGKKPRVPARPPMDPHVRVLGRDGRGDPKDETWTRAGCLSLRLLLLPRASAERKGDRDPDDASRRRRVPRRLRFGRVLAHRRRRGCEPRQTHATHRPVLEVRLAVEGTIGRERRDPVPNEPGTNARLCKTKRTVRRRTGRPRETSEESHPIDA